MDVLSYKTKFVNKDTVEKKWYLIDASQNSVGRVSSEVAKRLRGKHKPSFSPHVDCGDKVVVINAEQAHFTGRKFDKKEYVRYTGYPGGQRRATPRNLRDKDPRLIIEKAVKGMLPKNKLGDKMFNNLHVYKGSEHPHEAQQPEKLDLDQIK